jgi:hypothetical protein
LEPSAHENVYPPMSSSQISSSQNPPTPKTHSASTAPNHDGDHLGQRSKQQWEQNQNVYPRGMIPQPLHTSTNAMAPYVPIMPQVRITFILFFFFFLFYFLFSFHFLFLFFISFSFFHFFFFFSFLFLFFISFSFFISIFLSRMDTPIISLSTLILMPKWTV